MKGLLKLFPLLCLMPLSAFAATSIPFTVNMSEAVTVNGCPANCPRIAVDVGGVTRYAVYSAGSGTNTLAFTYQMVSGDVDNNGVTLTSPIDLNGGSIKDAAGNDATLTFVSPNTSGILIDASVPSGYTATFNDRTVTNVNKASMGFQIASAKVGTTYNYTISSSGGGAPLIGSGTVTAATQNVNGINLTSLTDGKLTLSVTLTDSLGGVGTAATDTAPMAVLDASLVGHWTFDANDISGTTAYDRSGSGNNGATFGSPVQVAGRVGGALNFNGTTNYVQSGQTLGTMATFAFWSTWTGVQSKMPFAVRAGSPGPDVFFFSGKISWNTYDSASNPFANIPATASNGAFHYYVVVVSAGSTVLYYDGTNIGSAVYHSPAGTPVQIGGHNTYRWSGIIDDFRIYNRALSPTEVTTLYNAEL